MSAYKFENEQVFIFRLVQKSNWTSYAVCQTPTLVFTQYNLFQDTSSLTNNNISIRYLNSMKIKHISHISTQVPYPTNLSCGISERGHTWKEWSEARPCECRSCFRSSGWFLWKETLNGFTLGVRRIPLPRQNAMGPCEKGLEEAQSIIPQTRRKALCRSKKLFRVEQHLGRVVIGIMCWKWSTNLGKLIWRKILKN